MATPFRLKRSAIEGKRPSASDLQLGELALNTYDGFLYTEREGVGLATVTNLTPWTEAYGGLSIHYDNSVGIGTTVPRFKLDVRGDVGISSNFIVTGISTFTGNIDANGNLDVDGQTDLDVLNVAELATFSGNIDANGNLDVDGTTELDGLNVDGASTLDAVTIDGLLDINAGGQANTFKVEDLTSGRVVIAGTGGELEDSGNLLFNGTDLSAASLIVSDLTEDRVLIAGGSGAVEDSGNLTFNGNTLSITGSQTISGNLSVTGISTLSSLGVSGTIGGFDNLEAPHSDTIKVFTVVVATKTTNHRYHGQGSSLGYKINGVESPFLTLTPGRTYRFDQSDNTNSNHPINFYLESDKTTNYTTGVTVNGTAGNSGAYTQIVVGDETPIVLHYQCTNHGYMGNAIQSNANVLNTNYKAIVRNSITGFDDLSAPHSDTIKTYTVVVASKDSTHRYQGQGSGLGYKIDGVFSPFLTLTPGRTYRFDQSDSSNSNHPINFYLEADKTTNYTTGVTVNGTAGNSGAYTQIAVGDETPIVLHYQCTNHGYMGNAVQNNSNVVNSNYAATLRGGLSVTGGETTLSSATISDLTSGRVVLAGSSGALQDSGNLTFNGSQLSVTGNVNATEFHTGASGSAIRITSNTISGPATFTLDPAGVGDNTGKVIIAGDLQVDGTTTTVNSTTVNIVDKNIQVATGSANDAAANGGGITIASGDGNKTFQFEATGDNLGSSENLNLASGKDYKINNTSVLNATTLGSGVVNSSLTNVGTLTALNVSGLAGIGSLTVAGVSTFAGNINANGNIVGDNSTNITGIAGVTASTLTGTLQTAAQTNITSVGTLGSLIVSGGAVVGSGVTLNATGVIATGVVTATSFSGDGSNLTGIDASSLSFGGAVKVQANGFGAVVTGVTTSSGGFSGNLTGNVTGNVTGNLSGTATLATDLAINGTNQIVYQDSNNDSDVLPTGNAGQILASSGAGAAPQWVNSAPAGAIEGITIRDESSIIGTANSISTINFLGSVVTADAAVGSGIATVTINAIAGLGVSEGSGSKATGATGLDFVGPLIGVDASSNTGISTVRVDALTIKDEGSTVGTAGSITTINFVGSGIAAAVSGNTATVTSSGGVTNADVVALAIALG